MNPKLATSAVISTGRDMQRERMIRPPGVPLIKTAALLSQGAPHYPPEAD